MDPVSQAALGAAVGHAFFHRQLGMKAAGLGALAGLFPDIDSFYGSMEGPFARLVSHRGITHSLFFGPVVGSLFGWLYWRRLSYPAEPSRTDLPGPGVWIGLFVLALLSHPLLDLCTHYGTQLLAPLARTRFALPAVPVVAPVYTLTLGIGIALAAWLGRHPRAGWCTGIALVLSTAYLVTGLRINALAEAQARQQLEDAGIQPTEVYAFPTMLQLSYRRLVAFTPDKVHVGYISMWHPCPIHWSTAPRPDGGLVAALKQTSEGQTFSWFAAGILGGRVARNGGESVVELSDLRYGFDHDARSGLWGIRGRFNARGELIAPPERFRNRPAISGENIGQLWARAFPEVCLPPDDFRFAGNS
jgi:inner membrane protein